MCHSRRAAKTRRRSLLEPAHDTLLRVARRPRSGTRAGRAPRRVEAPLEETCSQAEPGSASCVQRFDDSLNSAIRTTYRISLRSSSLREPRYPSTRVVCLQVLRETHTRAPNESIRRLEAHDATRMTRSMGHACRGDESTTNRRRRDARRTAADEESAVPAPRAENTRIVYARLARTQMARRPEARREANRNDAPTNRTTRLHHSRGRRTPQFARVRVERPVMILPQVHLRKPCYDFSFL